MSALTAFDLERRTLKCVFCQLTPNINLYRFGGWNGWENKSTPAIWLSFLFFWHLLCSLLLSHPWFCHLCMRNISWRRVGPRQHSAVQVKFTANQLGSLGANFFLFKKQFSGGWGGAVCFGWGCGGTSKRQPPWLTLIGRDTCQSSKHSPVIPPWRG